MQLFVVGPPRSGTTIVAQFLNQHDDITIFDEIDLIQVADYGASVVGTLQAFLTERGVYDAFRQISRESGDPAAALRATMTELARPASVWGEKNPRYATRLDDLKRSFPDAIPLFVLRDPREVVNSFLLHRDSWLRTGMDFWIKDTVAEALALAESCLEPLTAADPGIVVLRYEDFTACPNAALDTTLREYGLTFSASASASALPAPDTAGDHQFERDGTTLPWKSGNLAPLRSAAPVRQRMDARDPAWARVDALARRFGYG